MSNTAVNPIKSHFVQYDSMEPTVSAGSDVIVDRSYYSKHKPKRWDVVIFSFIPEGSKPGSAPRHYLKRIIGLPGETIHLTPKGLKINGAMMSIPPILQDRFSSFRIPPKSSFTDRPGYKFGIEPYTIPEDSVF